MSCTYISVALRQLVDERAQNCCEYCLMPEMAVLFAHQVDHIIAEKHGGATDADNLALACVICNKYKGSDIASIDVETDEVVRLYHPRRDVWREHFVLTEARILPLSAIGRVTANLLQLNRIERIAERKLLIDAGVLSERV
jgi:hypothetical protein